MQITSLKTLACVSSLALVLAGCSELSSEQISQYQEYNISAPLYAKMRNHQKLTLSDVVELSQARVRSSSVMTYLSFSHSQFSLTDEDVRQLKEQKVEPDVITYMREKPDKTGGLLSAFQSDFFTLSQNAEQ